MLVVTLDTWAASWRPWDLDNAYIPFLTGMGDQTGFTDPAFREHFAETSGGKNPEDDPSAAAVAWTGAVFSGAAHTWDQLGILIQYHMK